MFVSPSKNDKILICFTLMNGSGSRNRSLFTSERAHNTVIRIFCGPMPEGLALLPEAHPEVLLLDEGTSPRPPFGISSDADVRRGENNGLATFRRQKREKAKVEPRPSSQKRATQKKESLIGDEDQAKFRSQRAMRFTIRLSAVCFSRRTLAIMQRKSVLSFTFWALLFEL